MGWSKSREALEEGFSTEFERVEEGSFVFRMGQVAGGALNDLSGEFMYGNLGRSAAQDDGNAFTQAETLRTSAD